MAIENKNASYNYFVMTDNSLMAGIKCMYYFLQVNLEYNIVWKLDINLKIC